MAEKNIVTRWSTLIAVVDAQMNFDMTREEFIEILLILHAHEAVEQRLRAERSLIGPLVEVQDSLWDYLSEEWGLGLPVAVPDNEGEASGDRELDS
jgi:hypothetical protein